MKINAFPKKNERFFRLNIKADLSMRLKSLHGVPGRHRHRRDCPFMAAFRLSWAAPPRAPSSPFWRRLILLYEPVKRLTNVNNTIQQGIAGAERVFSIIDMETGVRNSEEAVPLPRISPGIDIENVTFRYEERPS